MLKKMTIYENKIELKLDNRQEVENLIEGAYPFEQERMKAKGMKLNYKIEDSKYLFYSVKNLFCGTVRWNKNVSYEQIDGDITDPIVCRLNCHIGDDGIFRITPLKDEGYGLVKGKLGFGVWQYARDLSFVLKRSGEFVISCRNSALSDFNEIVLDDSLVGISVELGEVQF